MSSTQSHDRLPVILSIPSGTLDELRARRLQRNRGSAVPSHRPILNIADLIKRIEEFDPHEAAKAFCADLNRLQTEVEDEYDAFLLDPGMGPMTYITSDGRILKDCRTWDGEGIQIEANLDHVIAALVVGAKKTGIASLLDLIPKLENGVPCPTCNGTRWYQFQNAEIVCPMCFGRAEISKS